jgi:hypothetical protein
MFTVIPIRSGLPYDPWADYNADDKIDIKDVSSVARLFGTLNTDNLTRNVNVTNFPLDVNGNLKTTGYVPSGTFTTSSKIVIQTTSSIGSMEKGIFLYRNVNTSFVFVLDPLSENFNVTVLCFQLIYYPYSVLYNEIKFYLNDVDVGTLIYESLATNVLTVTFPIQDSSVYTSLHKGINTLNLLPQAYTYLQELDLLVSYEYST